MCVLGPTIHGVHHDPTNKAEDGAAASCRDLGARRARPATYACAGVYTALKRERARHGSGVGVSAGSAALYGGNEEKIVFVQSCSALPLSFFSGDDFFGHAEKQIAWQEREAVKKEARRMNKISCLEAHVLWNIREEERKAENKQCHEGGMEGGGGGMEQGKSGRKGEEGSIFPP